MMPLIAQPATAAARIAPVAASDIDPARRAYAPRFTIPQMREMPDFVFTPRQELEALD